MNQIGMRASGADWDLGLTGILGWQGSWVAQGFHSRLLLVHTFLDFTMLKYLAYVLIVFGPCEFSQNKKMGQKAEQLIGNPIDEGPLCSMQITAITVLE